MREQMAMFFAQTALYASVASADPGVTGATELTGVTRGLVSATAGPVDGTVNIAAQIGVPAGAQFSYVLFFDSPVGGHYCDFVAVSPDAYSAPAVHGFSGVITDTGTVAA